jgi:hypothetical protein
MAGLLTFTLIDDYGRTTTKRYGTSVATVALAQTAADALLVDMALVSDLGHVKIDAIFPLAVTVPVAAGSGSNVDVGATLHTILESDKGYALKIPAIKATLLNADGSVDIADAAITDFVANFQTGLTMTVSDGEQIATIRSGELDK